jgi:hypothetical protein
MSEDPGQKLLERLRRALERWGTINVQEQRELGRMAARLPPEGQYDVLARPFREPFPHEYDAQEYVGTVLLQLQPPCPIDPAAALRKTLPGWNRSVEQLPFYFERAFGREALLAALVELEAAGDVDPVKLATVRFWLKAPA